MKYAHYILKRKLEHIFLYPFVLVGRLIGKLYPQQKDYETFFFFPFYHTGGAEKVHALVTQATGNKNCIIYFTRKSYDKNFYHDFVASGCTIEDISRYTDNKFLYFLNLIYRGIISSYINSQKQRPIVFNGQCNFAYKLSPWVHSAVPQVELIHSFNTFSWIRIPFIPFISKTIMISKARIDDHLRQYAKLNVPADFNQRIQYIVNGIPLPTSIAAKDDQGTINVLYAGRGTEEKRVHLIARIAAAAALKSLPVQFQFMGEVNNAIPASLIPFCKLLGHQRDPATIDAIYQQAHVVIITSYTEGFPMVIEEGMARGCAVIATSVGDIPYHVKHPENGLLFSSVQDEELIVKEGVEFVETLCTQKELLREMFLNNIRYAKDNFSIEAFNQQYQHLFKQLRSQ